MYKLSRKAEQDIELLYRYTIAQFGVNQATTYVEGLVEQFELLVQFPKLGKEADHIAPKIRSLLYQSHTIYYKCRQNDIFIVRVIHQRMEPRNIM
ncbi:hypothetical protein BMT54_05085 [Pasteurellaceae bacterium 15-036681]|nr:hypothetical protein BMT54_05085 [Pasteurellaceae bacterium 15-036681]